jgi:serine/threonine protein kinase
MSDPTDPALTVPKPQNASDSGQLDETAAEKHGSSSRVIFGPPAAAGEVGTLGPYRVLKALGKGGMGAVYLAVDTRLDRKLALKVMLPEFAADRDAKGRFLREARAAAKVAHDNVVTVYEADERDGVPYITMQLLQGYPLDEFLTKKGTPSLRHVIRIARETALGLAAAHKLGLVHRDIKPANLWLEAPNGRVKVLDFGLAKPVGTAVDLTQSGAVVGSPAYMSPEQARGLKVDHRTDLFSLGAVLYRLCTGANPFTGPTVMAVLMALGTEEPVPVRASNPNVPEPLAALIHRLLAKKPGDRPQTAVEVAKQLLAILEQLSEADADAVVPDGAAPQDPTEVSAPRPVDPAADRSPERAEVSRSQPVVVDPVPVRPPLVSRMEVSARPMGGSADEEAGDGRTAEPKPKRKSKGGSETSRSRRLLAAGAFAALFLVGGIVAGVWIAGGRQKAPDTTQPKADEKTATVTDPPAAPPNSPGDTPAPKPLELKPRWTVSTGNRPYLTHLYTSAASDLVLAASMQGDVLALDLKTGSARSGFSTSPGKVVAPDFFALDGKRVALTNTKTEEVQVWDEKTGQELGKWTVPHAPRPLVGVGTALRIYIAPNARYAVAARYQAPKPAGTVEGPSAPKAEQLPLRVIDLERKQVVTELTWSGGRVHFTADSARVLVADYQGRCSWVKLASGTVERQWAHPPGAGGRYHDVTGMSDDGSVLGYRGPARGPLGPGPAVIDGTSGRVIHSFSDEYFSTSAVSVSADGRRVAVQRAGADGSGGYDVLDSRTGAPLGRAPIKTDRSSSAFALTRDGTMLVIVSNPEKKVHAFELDKSGGTTK